MTFPVKEDHVSKGLALLISQWRDAPKVKGLLESYLRELNKAEDCLFEIINETGVLVAVGVNLDLIGELIDEARGGRDDESYRTALLDRIATNSSSGTPNEIEEALAGMTGATESTIFEHYPASFIPRLNVEYDEAVINRLQSIKPAGVNAEQVYFDPYEDGVVLAEVDYRINDLVDDQGNQIEVDNLSTIETQFYTSTTSTRSVLAEVFDPQELALFGSSLEPALFVSSEEEALFGDGTIVGEWTVNGGTLLLNGSPVDLYLSTTLLTGESPCAEVGGV